MISNVKCTDSVTQILLSLLSKKLSFGTQSVFKCILIVKQYYTALPYCKDY